MYRTDTTQSRTQGSSILLRCYKYSLICIVQIRLNLELKVLQYYYVAISIPLYVSYRYDSISNSRFLSSLSVFQDTTRADPLLLYKRITKYNSSRPSASLQENYKIQLEQTLCFSTREF